MKIFLLLILTTLIAVGSSCKSEPVEQPFVKKDCGCSGYYKIPKDGEDVEIIFSVVTAETLNGRTNCGYGFIKTRVTNALAGGVPMQEITKEHLEYVYLTQPDFDPKKDIVTFDLNDSRYTSRPETIRQIDDNVYFELHR